MPELNNPLLSLFIPMVRRGTGAGFLSASPRYPGNSGERLVEPRQMAGKGVCSARRAEVGIADVQGRTACRCKPQREKNHTGIEYVVGLPQICS